MFRIGRADRAVVVESQVRGASDAWKVSVVGEYVGSSAKLPHKGLCVRQAARTARCMSDVRESQRGFRPLRLKKPDERTVARRNRFPEQGHIVALVERNTPAVAGRADAAAVGSERLERQGKLRRAQARHRKKFTHPERRRGLSPRAAGATGLRRVRPGFRFPRGRPSARYRAMAHGPSPASPHGLNSWLAKMQECSEMPCTGLTKRKCGAGGLLEGGGRRGPNFSVGGRLSQIHAVRDHPFSRRRTMTQTDACFAEEIESHLPRRWMPIALSMNFS